MGGLAIEGGAPVREETLPYGGQSVDERDVGAVAEVLGSNWLTTGPEVDAFEEAFAEAVGAREAVAVANGTAALHTAIHALGVGDGDEVVVPPMTFAATANGVLFEGGRPVLADVRPGTLLLDPERAEERVTDDTRALVSVDYTGQPCDYEALQTVADRHGLALVADACHALGGSYRGEPVGSLADLNVFSLHPVKPITSGEGGVVTTDDANLARRMRRFRHHGMSRMHDERAGEVTWEYDVVELGYNYRLTDFQCALGRSQLRRLPEFVERRRQIAAAYDDALAEMEGASALAVRDEVEHGYHLYVVRLNLDRLDADRGEVFRALHAEGIGVNVHYIPLNLLSHFQEEIGVAPGDCPVAEEAYERILTLPVFPEMTDADVKDVLVALRKVLVAYRD